ncbi:hypothetical protein OFO10_05635 [Campylobacter sp. VBCF_06 NA8]|uniref:hypothetical protein n=1 Tax=unclassified Campylobacter TaxID=2593542 RepID=UPI0022E9CA16|nr:MULTISPECIES: hypothetical protein [unclassified Campylobacter]MDA3046635.1 hypothetical protein [Campylobacter sp. VBCF_06 NA8]MDA3047677.1 hypothetical protein [Campylobacter sp. JMF_08 NE1]MDA3077515.1 hypothetical protein [Campylobacter sp. JMF_06 NA1]
MITLAIIKGSTLFVYNGSKLLFSRSAVGVTLLGFTASSVTLASKTSIYTYDEKGRQISMRPR